MNFETPPEQNQAEENNEKESQERILEKIALAVELSEAHEGFPYPGINPDSYAGLKASEEEFPGFTTPIDELEKRFIEEGIKVVLGKNPESGNVYILPSGSDDIENDGIFPRQLQVSEDMDEKLKELISSDRG